MLLFLYGSDAYRVKRAVDHVVDQYRERRGPDAQVFNFDFEDDSRDVFSEISNALKAVSFFTDKKLIIVKNIFGSDSSDKFSGFIRDKGLTKDSGTSLVIVEYLSAGDLIKKNKKLWSLIADKEIQSKEFSPMSGIKLEHWVRQEAEALGSEIDAGAAKKLISFAGGDSWRLGLEVQKLASYKGGGRIGPEDVEALTVPDQDLNIFALLDALAGRQKVKALAMIEDRLLAGQDPHYLITMIAYQLKNMLQVKEMTERAVPYSKIMALTKLHPYVVKKAYAACGCFEYGRLKDLFSRLARLDIESKNGEINVEDGLYEFVLEF